MPTVPLLVQVNPSTIYLLNCYPTVTPFSQQPCKMPLFDILYSPVYIRRVEHVCTAKNMVPIHNVAVLAILLFVPSSYGQDHAVPIPPAAPLPSSPTPSSPTPSSPTTESPNTMPNPVSQGVAMWVPLVICLFVSTLILLNGMRFASLYSKTWLAQPNKQKIVFILALATSFIILAIWITLNTAFVPIVSISISEQSQSQSIGYKHTCGKGVSDSNSTVCYKMSTVCGRNARHMEEMCASYKERNIYIIAAAVLGGIFPLCLMVEAFFSLAIFVQGIEFFFYFFGTIFVNGQILAGQNKLKNDLQQENDNGTIPDVSFGDAYIFAVVCIVLQIVLFCLTGWLIWMRYTKV